MTHGGPSVSGGDIRWIQIAKSWQRHGIRVSVLTTEAGRDLCIMLGLRARYIVVWSSKLRSIYADRFWVTIKGLAVSPKELKNFHGIVYSASEGMTDVIPAAIIARKTGSPLVVVCHWIAPMVRFGTSVLDALLFSVNERIGLAVAKRYANRVLCVSDETRKKVRALGFHDGRLRTVSCGIDLRLASRYANANDRFYDGVFMKRLTATKGAYDAIRIWRLVAEKQKKALLAMVGTAPPIDLSKLKELADSLGIKENVWFVGPIYNQEAKFEFLSRCKVLISPSYEENWAIAIGEAVATGLKVVCYDLPDIRSIWGHYVNWIRVGDLKAFADTVSKLLLKLETVGHEATLSFLRKYDLELISEHELREVEKLIWSKSFSGKDLSTPQENDRTAPALYLGSHKSNHQRVLRVLQRASQKALRHELSV